MEIKNSITNLQKQALDIKEKINSLILSMPDNPDITRISERPRTFTVKFSTIVKSGSLNMSPYFYDWKYQYERLVRKVNQTEITNLIDMIDMIIRKGAFIIDDEKVQLHPEVIKQLKSIL